MLSQRFLNLYLFFLKFFFLLLFIWDDFHYSVFWIANLLFCILSSAVDTL